ncbi:beta strand repeat-containing protein, partial [Ignatzschineria larvae]
VGTDIFGYKTEARESTNTASLTYVAGSASAEHSELTINGDVKPVTIKADGEERATVVVTLKDEAGNPITTGVDANGNDYVVTLTGVTTGNSTPAARMTNNGDGTFTAYINSTKASETADTIGFEINSAVGGNTVDLSYVAGDVELTNTLIVANPAAISVSDGGVQSTITATLRDKFNNVIVATEDLGATIVVSQDGAGDARSLSASAIDESGNIVATVSSTKAATDSFTVEIAGKKATVEAQVRYTPGAASAAHSTIEAQPIEILADGTSKSRVTVQLKDQFGNNLTTQGGSATTVQLTNVLVADGVLATSGKVTASYIANGQFVVDITSTKAGSDTIGFEVNGEVGGLESDKPTATITYTTGNVDLNQSSFVAAPATIVVSEGDNQSTLTITLKDVNGNVIPASDAYAVTVGTVDAAIADKISAVSIDESTGTYKVTVSSTKVGTDTFYYAVDGSASPNLVTVTYTAGAIDLTQSTITAVPSEIAINKAEAIAEQEASIVTVELKDQFGNTVTGRAEVALEGLTHGTIRSQRFNTVTGLYTFDVISKDYTEGTDTVTFTVNGEAATGKEATITYKDFAKGVVNLAKSTIVADPEVITADGTTTSTLTVTLRDYEGTAVENAEGTVVITVEGQAIGTLVAGDTGYTATVSSTKVGTDRFGFTYEGAKAADTAVVEYTMGEFDPSQSTLVVAPSSITANGREVATAIVTLKDANGNVLTSDMSPVEMTFVGDQIGTVNSGNSTTFTYLGEGRYTASLTSTVTGTDTIGYTVGADAVAGEATSDVRYVAGPVSYEKSEITVNPAAIAADGTTEATVTVQLKDAFGNNITADRGTVTLTGITLGAASGVTFDNGVYTATVTSTKVGQDSIGFALNGVTANDTAVLEYTAGDVDLTKSTLEATPQTDIPANGSASSFVTVTLRDAQGNVVAGNQGVVVLTGISDKDGKAITLTYNDTNSRYEGTVSSIIADTYTVGFTLDGEAGTDTKDITFIASGASLLTSSITADPKEINVSRG